MTSVSSGVEVSCVYVPCFVEGTKIMAIVGGEEREVAIEALSPGDTVLTKDGPQPIIYLGRGEYEPASILGRDGDAKRPIWIKPGALGAGAPNRDLFVTPLHGFPFEGKLIEAQDLVNNCNIQRAETVAEIADYIRMAKAEVFNPEPVIKQSGENPKLVIYHIAPTGGHTLVLANKVWTETFCNVKGNAELLEDGKFLTGYGPDDLPQQPCYPLTFCGKELQEARRDIVERAMWQDKELLAGWFDHLSVVDSSEESSQKLTVKLRGWARNRALGQGEVPIDLDIYAGDQKIGTTIANGRRDDLREEFGSSGYHGFDVILTLPENASVHNLSVRGQKSGQKLEIAPVVKESMARIAPLRHHAAQAIIESARFAA